MKPLLLIPVLALPLLLAACETEVVDRHPRRVGYIERGDYRYHHHSDRPYVSEDPYYRRDTVIVEPRASYRPQVEVRTYNDSRSRYDTRDGRRVYENSGVYY